MAKGVIAKKEKIKFNPKRDRGIISKILFKLYKINLRFIRTFVLKFFYRYVGRHCEYYSHTLRKLFATYYKVEIGMYTHGGCFIPGRFPQGLKIGRYCSTAVSCSAFHFNHPMNMKSTHSFFFNPILGYTDTDHLTYTDITIGNDVWIGANAIILPSCSTIGDGAIIGAGAVVNKDVPPYGIVVGNPARVVRFRFSEELRTQFIESKWWEKPIEELLDEFEDYQIPIEGNFIR